MHFAKIMLRCRQLSTHKMTRPDVVMTEQRLCEVEGLAHTMLLQSVSITPHQLADRARINWLDARDVLQGLVRKGHAMPLLNGRFGRASESPKRPNGNARVGRRTSVRR